MAPLDEVFGALADPTRRAMLERLAGGEASVSELAAPFDMTLPGITRHVRVLENAGLLASRKDGRVRRCRIVEDPLRDAIAWMVRYGAFWEERLDALELLLGERGEESAR